MRKKWLIGLSVLFLVICLSGYRGKTEKKADEDMDADSIRGSNIYEIAFISEEMQTGKMGPARNIWEGAEQYADKNAITHCQYRPEEDSSKAREDAVKRAVKKGARVVIACGSGFGEVFGRLQNEYPKIQFLLLDAEPCDAKGDCKMQANMHCILFREEEAGYLAGYSVVSEGCTRLGFLYREDTQQIRSYGCGFIQGAEHAAGSREIELKCWNIDTDIPLQRVKEEIMGWYEEGTEVVFACEDMTVELVQKAAKTKKGKMISAAVQQEEEKTLLAAVEKKYDNAVIQALEKLYDNGGVWTYEQSGRSEILGIKEDGLGIVQKNGNWNFDHFSRRDYKRILKAAEREELQIDTGTAVFPKTCNVRVHMKGEQ